MTTHNARRPMIVWILPLLLLAVGCDSQSGMVDPAPTSGSAEAFTIRSSQIAMSPTTWEGTFKVFGSIDDTGASREVFASAEPLHALTSLYGRKTLKGRRGTITIEFYVGLSATDQDLLAAKGGFSIVESSGAYAALQGGGEIDLELSRNASAMAITEVLEGEAWYGQ